VLAVYYHAIVNGDRAEVFEQIESAQCVVERTLFNSPAAPQIGAPVQTRKDL
jgi:hypothetical protein